MAKTLSLGQEDANDLRNMESHAKKATNNAIGESFATVQQFHCISGLNVLSITAKHQNFLQQTGCIRKKQEQQTLGYQG